VIAVVTKSPEDTREMAAALAPLAKAGDLVLLGGDLGAGKTTFVQGFGRALGVDEPITSPTFVLMRNYPGRLKLFHVDVYRLDHLQEVVDLGISELIDTEGVALVEWGDVAEPALPADFLDVRIEYGDGDDERRFRLRPVGSSWSARQAALRRAVTPWMRDGPT
jgi:tRNA threonylcarbamoyladenosine biosynthesis protein TsaE